MTTTSLVLGSPQWLVGTSVLLGLAAVTLVWSYARVRAGRSVTVGCAFLKMLGFAALALCLLEPLLAGSQPRKGANIFVVLADNSQSLNIRYADAGSSRADWMRDLLQNRSAWLTRLGQDYDRRGYVFDTHLRTTEQFEAMDFAGTSSSLHAALTALGRRFRGLPLAGVLLVSDGNATDTGDIDWSQLPPVYPVLPPSRPTLKDIAVTRVTHSQTNFEAAPVVLQAEVTATGFQGQAVIAAVVDEAGKEVERQQATLGKDGESLNFRFQIRPERPNVSFYRVQVRAAAEAAESDGPTAEQTLANNSRLVVVDRGGGPYRILYVSGRPNWEFKFLRRSLAEDEEVQLVGLVRVARRQARFDFRDMRSQPNNLFKGFDPAATDTAERRDQPVLIRLGTVDEDELRAGFPQTAADLYRYHAVILDDLEAAFFTQDQLGLLRNFVSQRGGGLLMLGGPDSFTEGRYDRTPVGDLLPVYLDRPGPVLPDQEYRLVLTREGWLQPWVRTRRTEDDETRRLAAMAPFLTVNTVHRIKPGAAVLSEVRSAAGQTYPALVAQQFGKGRSAALLVADFWRWGLRREDHRENDFERSWRQTVRWLVGDVPGRVDFQTRANTGATTSTVELTVRALDPEYLPLDNAHVAVRVTLPTQEELTLTADPDHREAGLYVAKYVPKRPGAYRATATVTAPDGSLVGRREVGWGVQPEADEFARLEPNRSFLEEIAVKTKGEVVASESLESFVARLWSRGAPVTESWVIPLWHHVLYFLITVVCLTAEWGLRRVNGLA